MTRLDPEDPDQVGKVFGISSMLAQEVTYLNDEYYCAPTSPEDRWIKIHAWATRNLKQSE